MSQAGSLANLGSGGTPITRLNGDIGFAVGATILLDTGYQAGATAYFQNSGSVSTLNLSDASQNTILGRSSGNLTYTGNSNTSIGCGNLQLFTTAIGNVAVGFNVFQTLTSGNNNVGVGKQTFQSLKTGINNIGIGISGGAYTSSESNNILIQNAGVVSESNAMRLGVSGSSFNQINKTFIAGIAGVSVANTNTVTINSSTGQLGSQIGNPIVVIKGPTIDITQAGTTVLFTPSADFFVTAINTYAVTIDNITNPAAVNIGWTAANYDDLISGFASFSNIQGHYSVNNSVNSDVPYLPASTSLIMNVNNPATATTDLQRIDIIGYYL